MHRMRTHGLSSAVSNEFSCRDSLFETICYLVATNFNVQSLRLYIVQSFCNAITSGDHIALHFLNQHLMPDVIFNMTIINSWQAYLVNMVMHKKGKIEGGPFYLQRISIIFNVNIQVWSSRTMNILSLYPTLSTYDKKVDVLSF